MLLIGYGNPLRGDDGVGWHIADAVRAAVHDGGLQVMTVHQLTPELADAVAAARRVIFVDASCDTAPGSVVARPVACATGPPPGFGHQYPPGMLLRLAQEVYNTAPAAAWLVTVGVADLDCGEGLSPVVQAAAERARTVILRLLHATRGPVAASR